VRSSFSLKGNNEEKQTQKERVACSKEKKQPLAPFVGIIRIRFKGLLWLGSQNSQSNLDTPALDMIISTIMFLVKSLKHLLSRNTAQSRQ
jgi:hypothetical protein